MHIARLSFAQPFRRPAKESAAERYESPRLYWSMAATEHTLFQQPPQNRTPQLATPRNV